MNTQHPEPVAFFLAHAGYSYDPKTQTPEQGRLACAQALAQAEDLLMRAMRRHDVRVVWEHDEDAAQEGGFDDTCEMCCLSHGPDLLVSLGAIWDASPEYRRVIRAELASEATNYLQSLAS